MPIWYNDLEKTHLIQWIYECWNIQGNHSGRKHGENRKVNMTDPWGIPTHFTMPRRNGSKGSRRRWNGKEDQVQIGHRKNTYQGVVKLDKDWNLYSRVSNWEVICNLTKINFNAMLEAPGSQSTVGWRVIRKWQKWKYRLLFWKKLLYGEGEIGHKVGNDQLGRILYVVEYVYIPKGNTAARKRLKIFKAKW